MRKAQISKHWWTNDCSSKSKNPWYWVYVPQQASKNAQLEQSRPFIYFGRQITSGRIVTLQLKKHMAEFTCVRRHLEHGHLSFASANTTWDSQCTSFREMEEVLSCLDQLCTYTVVR